MRIGLIIYGSLATVSGGYLYDRKLVAHLRANGDEVTVISLPWSSYGRHLSHNFSHDLLRRLRNAPFDLLLQDELNHPSLFWINGRLSPHISYPIISIVHHLRSSEAHPRWQLPLYRQIERRYLRSVDGFVFNSQTTKRVVEGMIGADKSAIVATPAGDRFQPTITIEEITARSQQGEALRLLFVGNLMPRKGLHRLIAALAKLPKMEWRLEVVGETAVSPTYTRRIQDQIARAGLADCITLHGVLDDGPLAAQYHHAHLLVVPSEYEGFGIVYLEAMSFGVPAVGTTSGAAGEIIQHGENGYLMAGEGGKLAHHLHYLHHNRDELARLSVNARQHFLTAPTWGDSVGKIRPFLESLATN